MIIDWQVIPHKEQRYHTVGDWWWDDLKETVVKTLYLRISRMSDPRYELLVGIHELIEVMLCEFVGITQIDADRFDTAFEKIRARLLKSKSPKSIELPCGCRLEKSRALEYEPGDDIHAPYHDQHQIASVCERALAFFLGVKWGEYEREVELL